MIICIGREYGSGGHEIGARLAENLQLPFYDQELIARVMEKTELFPPAEVERVDEKKTNPLLHSVYYGGNEKEFRGLSSNDITFKLQGKVILEAAKEGGAVFVGRCADFILEQAGIEHRSIFICAPFSDRVNRKMKQTGKNEKAVTSQIRRMDKQRKSYYNYYTGRNWGKPCNYELCINSSVRGIEETPVLLAKRMDR